MSNGVQPRPGSADRASVAAHHYHGAVAPLTVALSPDRLAFLMTKLATPLRTLSASWSFGATPLQKPDDLRDE
jgi:hypothetical protein